MVANLITLWRGEKYCPPREKQLLALFERKERKPKYGEEEKIKKTRPFPTNSSFSRGTGPERPTHRHIKKTK